MHTNGGSLLGLAAFVFTSGREAEMMTNAEWMQAGLAGMPYAAVDKKWADDPAAKSKVKMVCISCHEPSRFGEPGGTQSRVEIIGVLKRISRLRLSCRLRLTGQVFSYRKVGGTIFD